MEGPQLNYLEGFSVKTADSNINKFNFNTECVGSCTSHQPDVCQYGRSTTKKSKSVVTALYPALTRANLTSVDSVQGDFENGKKFNLKYFSAAKNSSVDVPKRCESECGGKGESKNVHRVEDCDRVSRGVIEGEITREGFGIGNESARTCCCGKRQCLTNATTCEADLTPNELCKIRKCNYEDGKVSHFLAETKETELSRNGKSHKLLDEPWELIPCGRYFLLRDEKYERRDHCGDCYEFSDIRDLINLQNINKTKFGALLPAQRPYSNQTYCLNRRERRNEYDDPYEQYSRASFADASVETSAVNVLDLLDGIGKFDLQVLIEALRRHGFELRPISPDEKEKDMPLVVEEPVKDLDIMTEEKESSGPSAVQSPVNLDKEDGPKKLERKPSLTPSEVERGRNEEALLGKDPNKVPPVVQEIKYYEGNMNIFGIEAGKEDSSKSPFFRITKTVTFGKDAGVRPGDKGLGIDSWMQTDGESASEPEGYAPGEGTKTTNKDGSRAKPTPKDPFLGCPKICCDCLKTFANSKLQPGKVLRDRDDTASIRSDAAEKMDKSTSVEKGRQLPQSGKEFLKLITDAFVHTLPKDVYNRMVNNEDGLDKDEGYEVVVKSYEKDSTESCNSDTCKMRNPRKADGGYRVEYPSTDQPKNDKEQVNPSNSSDYCTCCDVTGGNDYIPQKSSSNKDGGVRNNPTADDTKSYDCQITINGRKILVKVNKSVEDLLLSGNIHNVHRVASGDLTNKKPKLKQDDATPEIYKYPETRNKMAGNCTCGENAANDQPRQSKVAQRAPPNTPRNSIPPRRDTNGTTDRKRSSFNNVGVGRPAKKLPNEGRNPKTGIMPPPSVRKPDRSLTLDKNTDYSKARNLYWCSVDIPDKVTDKELDELTPKPNNTDSLGKRNSSRKTPKDFETLSRLDQIMGRPLDYTSKVYERSYNSMDLKSKVRHRSQEQENAKLDDDCYPLYWESKCPKYYDRLVSKDSGNSHATGKYENYKSELKNGESGNLVQQFKKRMVVTPANYAQCKNAPPLCLLKIGEEEKRDSRACREFTVANLTSLKLNSNPFHNDAITCRKCIETLQSCANVTLIKECNTLPDDNQSVDFCNYCWDEQEKVEYKSTKCVNDVGTNTHITFKTDEYCNVVTNASQTQTNMDDSASYDSLLPCYDHPTQNYCCIDPCWNNDGVERACDPNEWSTGGTQFSHDESDHPEVLPLKRFGICFNITRVKTSHVASYDEINPHSDKVGSESTTTSKCDAEVMTSEVYVGNVLETLEEKNETADGEIIEDKVEKRKSFIAFTQDKSESNTNLKKEEPAAVMDEVETKTDAQKVTSDCAANDIVTTPSVTDREGVKGLPDREDNSHSELTDVENVKKKSRRGKKSKKSWKFWLWWWWRRKD